LQTRRGGILFGPFSLKDFARGRRLANARAWLSAGVTLLQGYWAKVQFTGLKEFDNSLSNGMVPDA
jgi:hypothetical protein